MKHEFKVTFHAHGENYDSAKRIVEAAMKRVAEIYLFNRVQVKDVEDNPKKNKDYQATQKDTLWHLCFWEEYEDCKANGRDSIVFANVDRRVSEKAHLTIPELIYFLKNSNIVRNTDSLNLGGVTEEQLAEVEKGYQGTQDPHEPYPHEL